jgi:hypothetical protein
MAVRPLPEVRNRYRSIEVFRYASQIHFLVMTLFHPVQPYIYIQLKNADSNTNLTSFWRYVDDKFTIYEFISQCVF